MVIKVRNDSFSGVGKVYDGTLADAVRGLAMDHAQLKIQNAGVTDLVDSSTGTAALAFAAMVIPTAAFDASSTGGAPITGFDTAAGKFENACAVIADHMNNVRSRIGLDIISWAIGTIATPGTIPAQDLTLTAASGSSAISFVSGLVSMKEMVSDLRTLIRSFNEIVVATGGTAVANSLAGAFENDYALGGVTAAAADAVGTAGDSAIADTVMDTFLTAAAANIATLAAEFNGMFGQGSIVDLTDNSGGSASDTLAAVNVAFTAHTDDTTNSSPVAGLNAELPKLENNFADLALRTNILLGMNDLALLVDGSGGTANTTLEVIDDTLTAVDGTASNTAGKATADVTFLEIANNIASLATKVNLLAAIYGVVILTDNSGGTAGALVPHTDTVGVDNGAAATGTSDAEVDAALGVIADAQASLAAKLAEMTGTGIQVERPLNVVAM